MATLLTNESVNVTSEDELITEYGSTTSKKGVAFELPKTLESSVPCLGATYPSTGPCGIIATVFISVDILPATSLDKNLVFSEGNISLNTSPLS